MHTHFKILWGVIAVLVLAIGGLSYVVLAKPTPAANPPSTLAVASPSTTVVVGAALVDVLGTITRINSNNVYLNTATAKGALDPILFAKLPALAQVQVAANTTVGSLGQPKDSATFQDEQAKYNEQIATLMKDPVKNKEDLATLQPPEGMTINTLSVSDLKTGDFVHARAMLNSDGTYSAVSVTRVPAPTPIASSTQTGN